MIRETHHVGDERSAPRPARATSARAVARLARQLEVALADVDLSASQYRMLLFLDEVGAAAASALAGRLDVTRPSVTALVDGLEARGLVTRQPGTTDRRRVEVALSADGQDVLAAADAAVARRLAGIAAELSASRAERATAGLGLWSDALDAHRARALGQP